ncbi:MAG: hypothetical protein B7Y70_13400, partial [Rhizobiales bacterium 35-68-8]
MNLHPLGTRPALAFALRAPPERAVLTVLLGPVVARGTGAIALCPALAGLVRQVEPLGRAMLRAAIAALLALALARTRLAMSLSLPALTARRARRTTRTPNFDQCGLRGLCCRAFRRRGFRGGRFGLGRRLFKRSLGRCAEITAFGSACLLIRRLRGGRIGRGVCGKGRLGSRVMGCGVRCARLVQGRFGNRLGIRLD